MKRLLATAIVAGAILAPIGASATHGSGCGYASRQEYNQAVGTNLFVYADTNGRAGSSETADQAVGVCSQGIPGGTFEAGHGANKGSNRYAWYSMVKNGVYVVADGDNIQNPDPIDGYVGVSNYETASTSCSNNVNCSGTNGGGNAGPGGGPYAQGVPLMCGNSTGASWDNSKRDGCEVP